MKKRLIVLLLLFIGIPFSYAQPRALSPEETAEFMRMMNETAIQSSPRDFRFKREKGLEGMILIESVKSPSEPKSTDTFYGYSDEKKFLVSLNADLIHSGLRLKVITPIDSFIKLFSCEKDEEACLYYYANPTGDSLPETRMILVCTIKKEDKATRAWIEKQLKNGLLPQNLDDTFYSQLGKHTVLLFKITKDFSKKINPDIGEAYR